MPEDYEATDAPSPLQPPEEVSNMRGLASIGGYQAKMARRLSTPEQLIQKRKVLEDELKNVNAALEFLEKNPEFTTGLHLISRALG